MGLLELGKHWMELNKESFTTHGCCNKGHDCCSQVQDYTIEEADGLDLTKPKESRIFEGCGELVGKVTEHSLRGCNALQCVCRVTIYLLGSYPPTETGRLRLSLDQWWNFKGMVSRSLRKTFLSSRMSQRLGEDLYLKETEKQLQIQFFSKKSEGRGRKSGINVCKV